MWHPTCSLKLLLTRAAHGDLFSLIPTQDDLCGLVFSWHGFRPLVAQRFVKDGEWMDFTLPFYSLPSVTTSTIATATIPIQATGIACPNWKSLQVDVLTPILPTCNSFPPQDLGSVQSLVQIRNSAQMPPMASQWIKSQIFPRILKAWFLWLDLTSSLIAVVAHSALGTHGSLPFLMTDWVIPPVELCTGCSLSLNALPQDAGEAHSST